MKKIFYRLCAALFITGSMSSCQDFFNPDTDDIMLEKDYIGSFTELYSGYMGVSSSVQAVAEKAMFIEGLRSNLLEPTYNAPQDFWDVYNYVDHKGQSLKGNQLADPKDYYNVIINANDYMKHAMDYHEKNPNSIGKLEFEGLVSGVIRYKAWAYLMLAKLYGEAIYFDDPLVQFQDITKFPMLNHDQLINKCIDLVRNGMYGFSGMPEFDWAVALNPATGTDIDNRDLSRNRYCPPADALLAELYLWQGNYQESWNHWNHLISRGVRIIDANYAIADWNLDTRTREDKWYEIFLKFQQHEHIAGSPYSYEMQQVNNLVKYFSDKAPNLYYMRPSQAAMDMFEEQGEKGRGVNYTYYQNGSNWVFRKFIRGNESSTDVYRTATFISMYRSKQIYLYLVESLVAMGKFDAALMFLNGDGRFGLNGSQDPFNPGGVLEGYPRVLKGVRYNNIGGYAYMGIRGHSGMGGAKLAEMVTNPTTGITTNRLAVDIAANPASDMDKDRWSLDSLIVIETMMECAGETQTIPAMLRMIRRWEAKGRGAEARKLWAEVIASKYPNKEEIQAKLEASIDNWFIKYELN